MKFLTRLALLFYVIIISILSGITILFALGFVSLEEITYTLGNIYFSAHLRYLVIGVSLALAVLSYIFARIISGSRVKEKTIAFDNPSGRVTVSLTAVEDLVRRLVLKSSEVKEVKPNIIAAKSGLEIEARLILRSEMNIPELTAKLQDQIKNKIQDIIGIEEKITVKIHIVKITLDESKARKKDGSDNKEELSVPFQGYRN